MIRSGLIFIFGCLLFQVAKAETMMLSTTSEQYNVTPIFSDVNNFTINIEIDAPLAAGIYDNPPIISVVYQVLGELAIGTPSEFPAFDLQRSITGAEFYAQGSSLYFEISESADLTDGIQADELLGGVEIFTFNAREIDNGRFHPAIFVLNQDSTGRIQNSNNIPMLDPLLEVDFGSEYITDLSFSASNLTLITQNSKNGGGSVSLNFLYCLFSLMLFSTIRNKFN